MIKTFLNDQAAIGADIALKNRLYVSGWQLSYELKRIRRLAGDKNFQVHLHYHGNNPNGVLVVTDNFYECEVFVRKADRRKGIGSALMNALKNQNPGIHLRVGEGLKGNQSFAFWEKYPDLVTIAH